MGTRGMKLAAVSKGHPLTQVTLILFTCPSVIELFWVVFAQSYVASHF